MARSFLSTLCAAFIALVVAIAPQTGLAQVADVDLTKLRAALRIIEAEANAGLQAPADVTAYWDSFALPDAVKPANVAPAPPQPIALPDIAVTPIDPANAPANDGGLFALQLSQTSTNSTTPNLTQPTFEAATPLATPTVNTPLISPKTVAPQDVGTTNFRIMLAALSQTYTGRNATAVVNAQGPRGPVAISVRAGTVTLADIQSYATSFGLAPLPDGTMTAPVVIWPDATLRLTAGERMALSRETGAFILAMGTLDIDGATIEVTGEDNPHTPSFTPFVTITAGGSLIMKNATMRGLGFGQTAKFTGLSVAGNLLQQGTGQVIIRDSLFDGLQTVTLAGVLGAKVTGNTFINARDNTLNLINAPQTDVSNNFFMGGSITNEIRVDNRSSETQISKNIFLAGQRVAILVAGGSDRVQVRDNLVWKRDGAGVKFLNTHCGFATGNILLDNRQKGVEVRKSDGTVVASNMIAGNGSAGIWVSAQQSDARTLLSGNVLVANGSGVSAATGAEILMSGNDFTNQLPRLLDGDIASLSRNVVTDLRGATFLRMKDGVSETRDANIALCGSNL